MYWLAELFPWARRIPLPANRDQFMLLLAAVNEIFLGIDIYLAHSMSGTIRSPYEWIPIIFGPVAGGLLLLAGLVALRRRRLASIIVALVGFASVIVGVWGTYFHLHRALLLTAPAGQQVTPDLLEWAPPLLGPLTFILIAILAFSAAWQEKPVDSGKLILSDHRTLSMPTSKTQGYFFLVGLFILATVLSSILDHSRTNFANPWLWLPTLIGIFATAVTIAMGFFSKPDRSDLFTYVITMALLAVTGLVGFSLHIVHNLNGQGTIVGERFLRGAPMLAPLLFANMGLLGLIVLLPPEVETTYKDLWQWSLRLIKRR
jgi:hypothetical protein